MHDWNCLLNSVAYFTILCQQQPLYFKTWTKDVYFTDHFSSTVLRKHKTSQSVDPRIRAVNMKDSEQTVYHTCEVAVKNVYFRK